MYVKDLHLYPQEDMYVFVLKLKQHVDFAGLFLPPVVATKEVALALGLYELRVFFTYNLSTQERGRLQIRSVTCSTLQGVSSLPCTPNSSTNQP